MFKIFNGLSGLNFNDFFKLRQHTYQLRNNQLQIEIINKSTNSVWLNSFFVRGMNLWNALPEEFRFITSVENFKHRINKFDLTTITKLSYN